MAALDSPITPVEHEPQARIRSTDYPAGSFGFDLAAALLGLWFAIGLFVDGYAHNHGMVDDTFFTPYHALMYSSILFTGIFLGYHQLRNTAKGYAFTRALPRGFRLSLIGVGLFFIGGGFDLWWHTTFGFEVSTEALLSPSHLLLATSAVLIVTGTIRSTVVRFAPGTPLNWRDGLPFIIALTALLSGITFFLQFGNLFTQHLSLIGRSLDHGSTLTSAIINGMIITATVSMGVLLFGARTVRLPFGASTLILTVNALGMFLLDLSPRHYWIILIGAAAAGLAADVILRLRLSEPVRARLFGFAVPAVLTAGIFLCLLAVTQIILSIHLWLGLVLMCGAAGFFISYLVVPNEPRRD
ncbi:MAG: hypothetical protein U0670_07700 [Anaerolineae bacterium]